MPSVSSKSCSLTASLAGQAAEQTLRWHRSCETRRVRSLSCTAVVAVPRVVKTTIWYERLCSQVDQRAAQVSSRCRLSASKFADRRCCDSVQLFTSSTLGKTQSEPSKRTRPLCTCWSIHMPAFTLKYVTAVAVCEPRLVVHRESQQT